MPGGNRSVGRDGCQSSPKSSSLKFAICKLDLLSHPGTLGWLECFVLVAGGWRHWTGLALVPPPVRWRGARRGPYGRAPGARRGRPTAWRSRFQVPLPAALRAGCPRRLSQTPRLSLHRLGSSVEPCRNASCSVLLRPAWWRLSLSSLRRAPPRRWLGVCPCVLGGSAGPPRLHHTREGTAVNDA